MSLIDILSGTLNINQNVRIVSEQQLSEAKKSNSFIFALLDVVNSCDDSSVCLSASLCLKNTIYQSWNKGQLVGFEEKQLFKEKLLKTLVEIENHSIISHVVSILGFLITSEPFPQSWPDLINNISQLLESPNPKHVYCGVICLIEVLRYYRWHDIESNENEHKNKHQIINAFLPKLLDLATSLLQQLANQDDEDKEKSGEILWRILKAYKQSIGFELNLYLQQRDVVEKWVNLFLWIITICDGGSEDGNSPVAIPISISLESSLNWRKCRKWSYELINLLFIRYSTIPQYSQIGNYQEYQEFSQLFLSSFASQICNLYVSQVKKIATPPPPTAPTPPATPSPSVNTYQSNCHAQKSIAIFFENCLRIDNLWNIIHNNLDVILSKLILSNLKLSQQDLYSYQYEPDQFYYENLSSEQDRLLTVKGASRSLIRSLVAHRDSIALPGILMTVNNILKTHINNITNIESCLDIDTGLQIMCSISDVNATKQSPIIINQMSDFIKNYILPIFYQTNQPFLISRSFQIVITYSSIANYPDELLTAISENISKFLDSSDILTKITSTLALQALLKYNTIIEKQSPNIHETMEKILHLYDNDVVSEILSVVMEELVSTFSKQLVPFTFKLCQHLSNQLIDILQELEESQNTQPPDYQFLDEKAESAQHILSTLSTLLNSFQDNNELHNLEQTISNIINPVFKSGEIDLYPDAIELIDILILTNKSVSSTLWTNCFTTFYEAFKTQPSNTIDVIIPSLSNFIAYGGVGITKERLEKIFEIIHYSISNPEIEPHVKQNASYIIQLILLILPDSNDYSITDLIPFIIDMPGRTLNMINSSLFRDPIKSLNATSLLTNFDQFLSEWNSLNITNQHELKLSIAGGLKLMSIDLISLQQKSILFQLLINNITKLQPSIISQLPPSSSPTFDFVDESHNFISSKPSFDDFEDELPPALTLAIDNINIKLMYIETINSLINQNGNDYIQPLIGNLTEKQRITHFSIIAV